MDNPQQPSCETPPLPVPADDLDGIITALAEKGIAEYLADADFTAQLVDWLHEETGIRRFVLKLAVRPVATLVERAAKEGGTWLGKVAADKLKQVLGAIPGYKKLIHALDGLVGRFDSEIAAKREFKEILEGRRPAADAEHAEDLAVELRAQLRLLRDNRELAHEMGEGFRETSAALARIEHRLNPEPPLKLKRLPPERASRFTYRAQVAPFVGRQQELAALKAFCDADHCFRWWLLAGPGGQGKSRLAFELCLSRANAWHAGILASPKFDWRTWEPERPTLIVADYAARDVDDLRKAAVALCDREHTFDFPVRLLLLERDPKGPWSEKFEGTDNARYDLAGHCHDGPLMLDPLGDEALWQVMLAFFDRAGATAPNKAETLGKLKDIDDDARPLFASLLADAWTAGGLRPDWSKEDLLTHVLAREDDQFWKRADVDDLDRNLLALATMTGGIALDDALGNGAPGLLPDRQSFEPDRYEVMCGRPVDGRVPALEPDIIGEFFVLSHLATKRAKILGWAKELHNLAWTTAAPWKIGSFLFRATSDFPRHESLNALLATLLDRLAVLPREAEVVGAANLIPAYAGAGDILAARTLWKRLAELAKARPDEPVLREAQAVGALNLIKAYSVARAMPAARALWRCLAALAEAYAEESALRKWQARGTEDLILAYAKHGNIVAARGLWEDLVTLAEAHPDEPTLREMGAGGAVNLINAYGTAGEIAEAHALWERLTALADAHAGEPVLRKAQAMGAVNLIDAYGIAGEIAEARDLWDRLVELAEANADEGALRVEQAKGAFNLISYYARAGAIAEARTLWERLTVLAEAHADEPALRERQAKGAVNLLSFAHLNGDQDTLDSVGKAIEADAALGAAVEALLEQWSAAAGQAESGS